MGAAPSSGRTPKGKKRAGRRRRLPEKERLCYDWGRSPGAGAQRCAPSSLSRPGESGGTQTGNKRAWTIRRRPSVRRRRSKERAAGDRRYARAVARPCRCVTCTRECCGRAQGMRGAVRRRPPAESRARAGACGGASQRAARRTGGSLHPRRRKRGAARRRRPAAGAAGSGQNGPVWPVLAGRCARPTCGRRRAGRTGARRDRRTAGAVRRSPTPGAGARAGPSRAASRRCAGPTATRTHRGRSATGCSGGNCR